MRKINLNNVHSNENEITEAEFGALIKANFITTTISNSSFDIKKATVIYRTPYGIGKKTISYIELLDNILEKGIYDGKVAIEGEVREWGGKNFIKEGGKWKPHKK